MENIIFYLTQFCSDIGFSADITSVFVGFSLFYLIIYTPYFIFSITRYLIPYKYHIYFLESIDGGVFAFEGFNTRFARSRVERKYKCKILRCETYSDKSLFIARLSCLNAYNFTKNIHYK